MGDGVVVWRVPQAGEKMCVMLLTNRAVLSQICLTAAEG